MLNTGTEMNYNKLFDDLQNKYYKTNDKKILEDKKYNLIATLILKK